MPLSHDRVMESGQMRSETIKNLDDGLCIFLSVGEKTGRWGPPHLTRLAIRHGAVANCVEIRSDAVTGDMKIPCQAARSIG